MVEYWKLIMYAQEDFLDTIRERQAQVIIVIYLLFAVLISYNFTQTTSTSDPGPELVLGFFSTFTLITPLIALGLFTPKIAEKRISGSLKVLLGLPISRSTIILGTMVARSLLISIAILAATSTTILIAIITSVSLNYTTLFGSTAMLIILGITFTSFAISISAIIQSPARAVITSFMVYTFFASQLWNYIPRTILYIRYRLSFPDHVPIWVDFISSLNPLAAYTNLISGVLPGFDNVDTLFIQAPDEARSFEQPEFAFGILVLWISISTIISCWYFNTSEI